MHINIIQHLRKFIDLSENEVVALTKYFDIQHFNKKENILKEGMVCKSLYFVEKGCLRMYFLNKKGVEQITQFALEGWWISDYKSFAGQIPSEYTIQTIEKSTIVSIDEQNLEALLTELPNVEKYFRKMLQKTVASAQYRSKLLYEMSKEEFFVHFSTTFPEFNSRVPQYMIASYLGLTPEYLSELRKKKG